MTLTRAYKLLAACTLMYSVTHLTMYMKFKDCKDEKFHEFLKKDFYCSKHQLTTLGVILLSSVWGLALEYASVDASKYALAFQTLIPAFGFAYGSTSPISLHYLRAANEYNNIYAFSNKERFETNLSQEVLTSMMLLGMFAYEITR